MGAKDAVFVDVVVFISNDGTNLARNNTRCGMCMQQPTFGREVGNVDGRGWLRCVWRTGSFWHDRRWGERSGGAVDRHELFVGWISEVEEEA